MPLNATWGYTAFVSPGKLPWEVCAMFGVTSVCFIVTLATSFRWAIQDCIKSAAIVAEEKRPIVPIHLELVRLIITTPPIISSMCVVCMIRPSAAFVLELLMAIFSCVVVGNMTRYFLALLGEPPLPQELLARVPKRRWWCGCSCGGVNDTLPLPAMGAVWSKVPHRVTLDDIYRATSMVRIFMTVFIAVNCTQLSFSMVPVDIHLLPSGWCESRTAVSSPGISGFIIFLTVWASCLLAWLACCRCVWSGECLTAWICTHFSGAVCTNWLNISKFGPSQRRWQCTCFCPYFCQSCLQCQ